MKWGSWIIRGGIYNSIGGSVFKENNRKYNTNTRIRILLCN
ncbi:hypothetical protein RB653_010331 [Dictyostelium firmibasis]|uniref:Uncharacterized protein n=1 Tax=Dictyostelium firmibasis TaxID=79012 RepID=A0AAN7YVM1_9MYCE